MKYVVNQRGRAVEIANEGVLQDLLRQGFIEITKKQFTDRSYYPEYDRGSSYKSKADFHQEKEYKVTTKERAEFDTTVV